MDIMANTQNCTILIRAAWVVATAFITAAGWVFIFELKQYYIGVTAVLIGTWLFVYKWKVWRKEDES